MSVAQQAIRRRKQATIGERRMARELGLKKTKSTLVGFSKVAKRAK